VILQHAEILFSFSLRIHIEGLGTEMFGYWKQVINLDCSGRKHELVKFTFNKITRL